MFISTGEMKMVTCLNIIITNKIIGGEKHVLLNSKIQQQDDFYISCAIISARQRMHKH